MCIKISTFKRTHTKRLQFHYPTKRLYVRPGFSTLRLFKLRKQHGHWSPMSLDLAKTLLLHKGTAVKPVSNPVTH